MKQTALTHVHRSLGARLIEFGGYEMPVQYASIIDEHKAVRRSVGVFDVSHMGEFFVEGPDALSLVQLVTVNDASKLSPGKAQYSAMCYPDGGIVDDLLVYRYDHSYMLVVNASNIARDFDWIVSHMAGLNVVVRDESDKWSLLAVQGPRSLDTLQKLTATDLSSIEYYAFVVGDVAGVPMTISRTGYTGELGFELYFDSGRETGEKIWNSLMDAGKEFGMTPVGLGARDTLRLEMGFCLYGNDIDRGTNPLEAGLGWITKLNKGEFIGRDALAQAKTKGLARSLVGFELTDAKAIPRHGYGIMSEGRRVGAVTSGTMSPTLEKGIGMGYVEPSLKAPGTTVGIDIRGRQADARIVKLPFIQQ